MISAAEALLGLVLHRFDEGFGARLGDRAQTGDDLIAVHADAAYPLIVKVFASSSSSMWMSRSACPILTTSSFVSISNCKRFKASEAFEISSRRKISFSVYKRVNQECPAVAGFPLER